LKAIDQMCHSKVLIIFFFRTLNWNPSKPFSRKKKVSSKWTEIQFGSLQQKSKSISFFL
jgi:hypothetical protein